MDNTFKIFATFFVAALVMLTASSLTACGSDSSNASEPTPSTQGASITATAIPKTSETLFVGNTEGAGVFLRASPNGNERIKAWPEGTAMIVAGQDKETEGRVWKNVKDPDGNTGWVPADYLIESKPATH